MHIFIPSKDGLRNKYSKLDGRYYYQVAGTAMGTGLGLSYVDLFMSSCEKKMLLHTMTNLCSGKVSLMTYF